MTLSTHAADTRGSSRAGCRARALVDPQKPLKREQAVLDQPQGCTAPSLPPGGERRMHRAVILPYFLALPAATPQDLLVPLCR